MEAEELTASSMFLHPVGFAFASNIRQGNEMIIQRVSLLSTDSRIQCRVSAHAQNHGVLFIYLLQLLLNA